MDQTEARMRCVEAAERICGHNRDAAVIVGIADLLYNYVVPQPSKTLGIDKRTPPTKV